MGTKLAVVMLIIAGSLLQVSGCQWRGDSGGDLYLPRGNAEQGRLAFIELQCHRCHTVTGVSLPAIPNETPMIAFNIGGMGTRVKTYSGLITAIINPVHITSPDYVESLGELAAAGKIETPMPSYNEQMTVAQLIDIVMFLNARYEDLFLEYLGHSYALD
jgi:hypothetical protein